MLKANEEKLTEVAKDAHGKRVALIQKYKKQKRGNVVIDLVHGCKYLYGETIPEPVVHFGAGLVVEDYELFEKTIWK